MTISRYALNRKGGTHTLLVGLVPPGSCVLDVGCASGYLGKMLAASGCTVVGVEVDGGSAAAARETGAYRSVHEVDLNQTQAQLPTGPFDVVLCGDVLEHLLDPAAVLKRLSALTSESGRFLISLPNVAHVSIRLQLLMGHFRYTDTGILDKTHLHLFTYDSAVALVEEAGLEVQAILAGSDRFGRALSHGPAPIRRLRGLLAHNIVLIASHR